MLDQPNTQLLPQAMEAVRSALHAEIDAIAALRDRGQHDIARALELISTSRGNVVVSGLGKSGHIGAKMAATLSSFGKPAVFMNSSEALHGDFGICRPQDVGIVISYSGRTAEVVAVARMMKSLGMRVIAVSRSSDSPIGQLADVHLCIEVEREADQLNLGPTASTAATLALGDALASGLQVLHNFTPADFKLRHPGGSLGEALTAAPGQPCGAATNSPTL